MPATTIVNVGVIGLLGWGNRHLNECIALPHARLLAVCDLDAKLAQAAAEKHGLPHWFTDYRKMLGLADLDAVVIAAPHFLHHPMAMDAIRAGKHVLCEKPFTTSGRHAREIVAAGQAAGVTVACDYNLRVSPGVAALRQLVAEGVLGEVYHARARWLSRWTGFMFAANSGWRVRTAQAGGGILIGRGSHAIDAVLFALTPPGRPQPFVKSVYATCHRLAGFEVEDLATVSVTLENGATIDIEASYVLNEPDFDDQVYWALHGTTGGASLTRNLAEKGHGVLKVGRCDMATGQWQDLPREMPPEAGPAGMTLLGDFVESIIAGCQPLSPGDQAAAVIEIIDAAYQSATSGQVASIGR